MSGGKTWWLVMVVGLAGGLACEAGSDEAGQTATWTNDRGRLAGDKAAHFVPFHFQFPADWQVLEDGTQPDSVSPNFVKVERASEDRITIENFAVGWYSGAVASDIVTMIEPQFAGSFPDYRKVSDQTARIDGIAAPGFVFQARVESARGPVQFYGRALAVPVGDTDGILMIMFASDLAPGVDGPEDVGEVGELPVILESFDIQE